MGIAVKIVLKDGTNIDFLQDEAIAGKLVPTTECELLGNDKQLPDLKTKGDEWNVLTLTFYEKYRTTKDKIKQIVDECQEMDIYYQYQNDESKKITAFLYPEYNEQLFYYGQPAANIEHNLTFMECLK